MVDDGLILKIKIHSGGKIQDPINPRIWKERHASEDSAECGFAIRNRGHCGHLFPLLLLLLLSACPALLSALPCPFTCSRPLRTSRFSILSHASSRRWWMTPIPMSHPRTRTTFASSSSCVGWASLPPLANPHRLPPKHFHLSVATLTRTSAYRAHT